MLLFNNPDSPGMLKTVAAVLGEHGVSYGACLYCSVLLDHGLVYVSPVSVIVVEALLPPPSPAVGVMSFHSPCPLIPDFLFSVHSMRVLDR